MRDGMQLKKICWAWITAMWSASAAAAQVVFVTDLSAIPLAAVAVAIVIALLGGSASTLAKIASPKLEIRNMWLTVLADMVASMAAGLGAFFLIAWLEKPPLLAAVCILVAGYGGSRVLDLFLAAGTSQLNRYNDKP